MADYDVSHLGDDFSACLFLASQDALQVFLGYQHAYTFTRIRSGLVSEGNFVLVRA